MLVDGDGSSAEFRDRVDDSELLRAFLDAVPLQVYFKDRGGRFIKVSQAHATKLGFAGEHELVGKTDFDVFAELHARSAAAAEREILDTGEAALDQEEREQLIDGSETSVTTSKVALRDEHGEIIGTLGIAQDVTAGTRAFELLRNTEERWRILLAHMEEIVFLVNADGVVTYTSPSARRWFGYEHEELVGVDLLAMSHEEDLGALAAALLGGDGPTPACVRHRVKASDGAWRWLESTFVSLHDNPLVAATLIAARDITAQLQLEEERERLDMERRVSQRLEAVGQLSAGIAHEINTPLQFVGDSVTFLSQAVDDLLGLIDQYRDTLFGEAAIPVAERRRLMKEAEEIADIEYLLERIPAAFKRTEDGIGRVRSIVQAMKRFSHTGAGDDTAPADLNDALGTTLEVCRNEYKYVANVVFRPGELPPVPCNISELNQVFLNLILNAAQAIEGEHRADGQMGTIEIDTSCDDDYVVVRITDDGPGIPLELQDRIYEPFFTTKEVGKGTGQGLALARTTIERHGGALECQSAPGEGTTFAIRLPLEPPAKPVA